MDRLTFDLLVLAGVVFLMIYSVALQKKAVVRQKAAIDTQNENTQRIIRSLEIQEITLQQNTEYMAIQRQMLVELQHIRAELERIRLSSSP